MKTFGHIFKKLSLLDSVPWPLSCVKISEPLLLYLWPLSWEQRESGEMLDRCTIRSPWSSCRPRAAAGAGEPAPRLLLLLPGPLGPFRLLRHCGEWEQSASLLQLDGEDAAAPQTTSRQARERTPSCHRCVGASPEFLPFAIIFAFLPQVDRFSMAMFLLLSLYRSACTRDVLPDLSSCGLFGTQHWETFRTPERWEGGEILKPAREGRRPWNEMGFGSSFLGSCRCFFCKV